MTAGFEGLEGFYRGDAWEVAGIGMRGVIILRFRLVRSPWRIILADRGYTGSIFGFWELLDVLFAFAAEVDYPFAGEECPVADYACSG